MVIKWDEVSEENAEQIASLFDRLEEMTAISDPLAREDAADRLYDEAAAIEYPLMMAMALTDKYIRQWDRGAYRESLATYVQVSSLTHKYGYALEDEFANNVRMMVVGAVVTLLQMPEASLAQIDGLVDTVESANRAGGQPLDLIYFCRATIAAMTGDEASIEPWIDAWLAAETAEHPVAPSIKHRWHAALLSTHNPQRALEILDVAGADPDVDERKAVDVRVARAAALARLGRQREAEDEATSVLLSYDHDVIRDESDPEDLLRALAGSRAGAVAVGLLNDKLGDDAPPHEHDAIAAIARHYLLDPATRQDGLRLRDRALAYARMFDARNGNDYTSRTLHTDYFADLPR